MFGNDEQFDPAQRVLLLRSRFVPRLRRDRPFSNYEKLNRVAVKDSVVNPRESSRRVPPVDLQFLPLELHRGSQK